MITKGLTMRVFFNLEAPNSHFTNKLLTMKKILLLTALFATFFASAQSIADKRFTVAANYSFTNDLKPFLQPISIAASYRIASFSDIDLSASLRAFYVRSDAKPNFSDKFALNPNLIASKSLLDNKIAVYAGVGYYYDSFDFENTQIFIFDPIVKRKFTTHGATASLGGRYFVLSNLFFDANATFIFANSKSENNDKLDANNTLLQLGIGVAF